MKKAAAVLVLVILAFGGLGLNVHAASSAVRATWLWNPWMIVNDEAGTLAFLESKQVNKVYVQIDREIPMKIYRHFITLASAKGIEVYALDGAPDWVGPKGTINQNKLFNWLKNYQKGSKPEQQFAGIHLDIEPYLYKGWTANQAATVKSYQALLSKAKTDASGMNLPLEADMPFWFDEMMYRNMYGKGTLAEWVIANTDSVTIMAYRDRAPMIMDIVEKEINLAGQYGKSLVIGVETGQTDEGEGITFFEEGEAFMNRELKAVSDYYTGFPSFKGIAVHHVGSWMELHP